MIKIGHKADEEPPDLYQNMSGFQVISYGQTLEVLI